MSGKKAGCFRGEQISSRGCCSLRLQSCRQQGSSPMTELLQGTSTQRTGTAAGCRHPEETSELGHSQLWQPARSLSRSPAPAPLLPWMFPVWVHGFLSFPHQIGQELILWLFHSHWLLVHRLWPCTRPPTRRRLQCNKQKEHCAVPFLLLEGLIQVKLEIWRTGIFAEHLLQPSAPELYISCSLRHSAP